MGLLNRDDEIKPWLGVPPDNTKYDGLLDDLNDVATSYIEDYTNRVIEEQDLTHRFNGAGQHVLTLREFPVSQVTRVSLDNEWEFLTSEDTTTYQIDNEAFLVRKTVWPQGVKNVEIDYTAGYAPEDLPPDIRQAALLLVEFLYRQKSDERLGITNEAKVSESATYQDAIPKEINDILDLHERTRYMDALKERAGG